MSYTAISEISDAADSNVGRVVGKMFLCNEGKSFRRE